MASSGMKRLCTNEGFIIQQDADCWRSKLIHIVDCKPASVSNWSFDESCLFCCLRREKVKEHVVALIKQIVESGGKPLLGKDPSNISRLEWQSEEFLDAVLHRREYTPRIPDPHIPVVACNIVQQMISQLATYYTSRNNCSQDFLQNNGKMDQSLLKASCVTSSSVVDTATTAASPQSFVINKFIMADQDAPLDLSLKKVKVENLEQDGVLDLSTKKYFNKGHTSSFRNSHGHVSPVAHLVKRDPDDVSLARVNLQSASTLEQFMSKLCLHHQRQIVDALGFLQSEVKTVATSSNFQALSPAPALSEEQTTTTCSRVSFEARSEIQWSERTCSMDDAVSITRTQESSVVRSSEEDNGEVLNADVSSIAPVMTEMPEDIHNLSVGVLSSCRTAFEGGNVSTPPKFQSLFIMKKTTSDHIGPKKVLGSNVQRVGTDTVKKCPCTAGRCLPACTAESDQADLSLKCTQNCSLLQNMDVVLKPPAIQRTSTVDLPVSPRTARKSRNGSCLRQRNAASSYILNEPDCDLVYIRKSITECQPQSHNRLHPRQNARKSIRGHKYIEEYLELKTVRTLALKSVSNASGNCPALVPVVHTSVTPKQSLSKLDSVPLMNAPIAGDCMKSVIQSLSSEQIPENEMPGDVVNVTSQGLMVETTQTSIIERNYQICHELEIKQSELTMKQDLITDALSCAPNTIVNEKPKDVVEVIETTETTELIVQKEGSGSQIGHLSKELVCGLENKAECQDKSIEPSQSHSVSPNIAKDDFTFEFNVEPTNYLNQNLSKGKIVPDIQEQSEAIEVKANAEEDRGAQEQILHDIEDNNGAQEQVLHDVEINLKTANTYKLPMKSQGDSEESILMEVTAAQPLLKCSEKDMAMHTQKDLDAKMVLAKQAVSSDRCLRSRGSKGSVDLVKDYVKCGASELVNSKMTQSNDESTKTPLVKQPLNSIETNVHSEVEHDLKTSEFLETGAKPSNRLVVNHTVKTKQKQKSRSVVEKDEHQSLNLKINNDDKVTIISPEVVPETVSITSTIESGQMHKGSESSEKMALRSSRNELSVSRDDDSPIKKFPPSSENMLLRSRSNIEQPCSSELSNPGGHPEHQGQMPLKNYICTSEQATNKDLCTSPKENTSESVMRMPSRSRTSSTIKQTVTRDSPVKSSIKRSSSSVFSEQPISSHSNTTCRKTETVCHMPLRSGSNSTAEMPPKRKSAVVDALESPGRMLLRRGNVSVTEKPFHSATPSSNNKRPPRQQRVLADQIQTQKNMEAQIRNSLNLPVESLCIASLPRTEPVVCSPPKFLEALKGEEHQQLISNLNAKFDKMQKGWVQMDKEGQPAPKHKNKADRLKEIWKSKRRIRKSRPSEQQKFSPVQMLFMKPFDLPSICRWFLQSTETKSLVIVKKVNTRLPSETQLCFQSARTGSSNGIFPSLQAERLKKHLKKFAIASPVKNNPKNQRLISKALGRDIAAMRSKEKHKPTTATRISTKAQSIAGVTTAQAPENLGTITGNMKNPASARILRKYSNMREKLQVQQSKKCKEKTFKGTRFKTSIIQKKATKQKLPTRKGAKSAIVQSFKSLTKKAKTISSTLKEQSPKRNPGHKDGTSPKRLQALAKVTKAKNEHASTNASSKKEALIKSGTDKAQQAKASGTKVDVKKSVLNKGPNSLEPQSLGVNMKPLSLEDQVLTRSQRKMEATPSHSGSTKSFKKRSLEPLVTPTKRTRTSKS
ncbi:uncharacterized protein wu:fc17b08 isoform X2 [Myxocyprinus asiaticus]|uniref:uncharacterized protein wu:fc17b08 isoform X2 n=1 Tax=Myxocyprinus asiaticus TaxID=70543 RepID=UPI002221CC1A|nr:uncharacterized protein wu:fc17b08 isoform X2 [Myxocyprinus asiaticus]